VDISSTVCLFLFVCLFVCTVTDFSAPRIKLAASNFARRFIGVQGRESHILGNIAPQKLPQKPKIRRIDATEDRRAFIIILCTVLSQNCERRRGKLRLRSVNGIYANLNPGLVSTPPATTRLTLRFSQIR